MKTMNQTLLAVLLSTLGLSGGLAEAAFDPSGELMCRTKSGLKIQANDNITGPQKAFAGSAQLISASFLRNERNDTVTILLGSGIRAVGPTMRLTLDPREERIVQVEGMNFYALDGKVSSRGAWNTEVTEDAKCFQPVP